LECLWPSKQIKRFDFVHYISSFDFISLVETFIDYLNPGVFSDHTVFCKPAIKLTKQGRRSGGVVFLIRNAFVPFVKEIRCEWANVLCFILDKQLFAFDKDVVYICTYIPPEHSPAYAYL
jgi:hypothetical protein